MEPLLYLVHRIPYPPNKGDKIRSFNLLKALSKHYDVYLGAFIDDPSDRNAGQHLAQYCKEIFTREIHPLYHRAKSLTALTSGRPLSVDFYRDSKFSNWVSGTLAEKKISKIVCFSAAMAQFLELDDNASRTRVMDFVDVDSQKWSEYSQMQKWPQSWIYGREAKTLRSYEIAVSQAFDVSTLVTDNEVDLFRRFPGVEAAKIHSIQNGVDTEYFSPVHDLPTPYNVNEVPVVFTGAMDYWANVDAVTWFASEILPMLRQQLNTLSFWVVGARPTKEVEKLADIEGVVVTGAVPDVRPYIYHSRLAVAPLRVARGVQNKVLEAMAMGKPVVATTNAMEGIQVGKDFQPVITDSPSEIAMAIKNVINGEISSDLGMVGREYVLKHHHWDVQTAKLINLIETAKR